MAGMYVEGMLLMKKWVNAGVIRSPLAGPFTMPPRRILRVVLPMSRRWLTSATSLVENRAPNGDSLDVSA